jgi:long-chain acyl-CoA synthetase
LFAEKAAGWKLMTALGGAIRFFGIGGAPISEELEQFLRKIKFPYAPGYGLTEAAPLVAGTAAYKFPFRSSGTVLRGIEVRIVPQQKPTENIENGRSNRDRAVYNSMEANTPKKPKYKGQTFEEEGEIQVRGPNIMMGYYKDEELTRDAFTADGWLRTGDCGILDGKGHLFVKGRIKALILGPSGENIYPEEIESLLNTSDLIEDALVYPGEKGELIALVVLTEKAKTMLAAIADNLGELKSRVNKRLAAFSGLSRIEVQDEPFEKTPTQKIKRFLYPRKS